MRQPTPISKRPQHHLNIKQSIPRAQCFEVQEKIVSLENDLSASQLRAISDLIQKDNPNDWVEFDLALADVKPQKKPALYVALSILLGGFFGSTFVLISNAVRKRKKTTKSA